MPDPSLHAHMFVFNITQHPEDEKGRSPYFENLNRRFHEARFHSRLSHALQHEVGVRVDRDSNGFWRVVSVLREEYENFSRRALALQKIVKKLVIEHDKKPLAKLAQKHRESKKIDVSQDVVQRIRITKGGMTKTGTNQ
ncbi:Relaxase domain-containing protein [Acanthopleuribacter pedis]